MATYDLATTTPSAIAKNDILNCSYSGQIKQISLPKGTYKLECWGAAGGGNESSGNSNSGQGGRGGYVKGTLTLSTATTLYLATGGQGASSSSTIAEGGFNGGGCAWATSSAEPANGGGGASDIRIGQNNLYSRVIVAGGGGGGGEDNGDAIGHAGGDISVYASSTSHSYCATQSRAGSGGGFGQGAHTSYDGGGGGGGWYGGGTAGGSTSRPTSNNGSDTSGGAGGSSYVYTSSTASSYPSGCTLNSSYYLTDTSNMAGNKSFTSPSGTNETGHLGNGYIRITVLEIAGIVGIYLKTASSTWKKIN